MESRVVIKKNEENPFVLTLNYAQDTLMRKAGSPAQETWRSSCPLHSPQACYLFLS